MIVRDGCVIAFRDAVLDAVRSDLGIELLNVDLISEDVQEADDLRLLDLTGVALLLASVVEGLVENVLGIDEVREDGLVVGAVGQRQILPLPVEVDVGG